MIVDRRELRPTIARAARDAAAAERRRRGLKASAYAAFRAMPHGRRTLADWLAHCERLHPEDDRARRSSASPSVKRERLGLRFDGAGRSSSAGTNGKGSTCAMLESIALRTPATASGCTSKPHLVHFEERCRIDGESVEAPSAAAALRGGRGGARRHRADLLRVHARWRSARAARGAAARPRDPRGRPRRPPRRGQRVRRRLRGDHQHRRRPHRVPRPRPRDRSAARRPASCAPASRRSSATRCRRTA